MNINKENLGKIIETLQSKYNSMADKDHLDFSSIKFEIQTKEKFIIPNNWYLPLPCSEKESNLILNWVKKYSETWDYNDTLRYHLIGFGYQYDTGHINPNSYSKKLTLISFEDFEKYIVNKK